MITANQPAPAFSGPTQEGKTIHLSDFAGQKLVLYFYPKDDTPGCTAQACNLRDNLASLQAQGVAVVGVSTDKVKSHQKFADKYQLNFPLIADEDQTIANAYGVWGEKKFMGKTYMGINRTTFLINEQGLVEHVIAKPDTKEQAQQIREIWGL